MRNGDGVELTPSEFPKPLTSLAHAQPMCRGPSMSWTRLLKHVPGWLRESESSLTRNAPFLQNAPPSAQWPLASCKGNWNVRVTHIPFPPTAGMVCISDPSALLPSFFPDEGGAAGSPQGGFAGARPRPRPLGKTQPGNPGRGRGSREPATRCVLGLALGVAVAILTLGPGWRLPQGCV